MLIKICGMREAANIGAVGALKPDMMGFIFYESSPRYAGNLNPEVMRVLDPEIQKTGVFVNADLEDVLVIVERYNISVVQLHGKESPDLCRELGKRGFKVIKAIGIEQANDLEQCRLYEDCCDGLLFDTKSPRHGGTGQGFDWNILKDYKGKLPFLLSGGISSDDVEKIKLFQHPRFAGIDLNSRFEIVPGEKNVGLLSDFMEKLKQ